MRRFYQTDWHNIIFSSFSKPSFFKLANSEFYRKFYETFFSIYKNWEQLNAHWLESKTKLADWIAERYKLHKDKPIKILSIGCGLGAVERQLIKKDIFELEITETGNESLAWLAPSLLSGKIHLGYFPDCMPQPKKLYDVIYLSAVDYCFTAKEWVSFLKAIHSYLTPNGRCLVLSASLEPDENFIQKGLWFLKQYIKGFLGYFRIMNKQPMQFWGYMRSKKDYWNSLSAAGFQHVEDGVVNQNYWIEGKMPNANNT